MSPARNLRQIDHRALLAFAIASAVIGMQGTANAALIEWNGEASQNWSDGASWVGGVAPANNLAQDAAHFNLASYSGLQPVIDVDSSVGGIVADGAGTLSIGGASMLSLGSGGIAMNASAGGISISAPLTIGLSQNWINSSAAALNVSGTITFAVGATLNVSGTGAVITGQTNDATGIVGACTTFSAAGTTGWATVGGGGNLAAFTGYSAYADVALTTVDTNNTLIANTGETDTLSNDLTTNSLKIATTVSGGQLSIAPGTTLTLTSGGVLFQGNADYTISGGTISQGGSQFVVGQYGGGNLTIASDIANPSFGTALVKSGPGTLTLVGAKSFQGILYLNQGIVNIDSLAASGSMVAAGGYVFNGGTLQYASPTSAAPFTGPTDITRRGNLLGYGVPFVAILSGGATIDTNGNNVGYAASIGGGDANGVTTLTGPSIPTGGLTKAGLGTLSVAPINAYAGPTVITGGGTLSVGTLIGQTGLSGYTGSSSNLTLDLTDTVGLQVGQSISGGSIAPGTTIAAIVDGTNITLNQPARVVFTPLSPSTQTGTTNGTSTLVVGSTAGLQVGQRVVAVDIPTNAYIAAIVNSTTLTLSQAATASTSDESIAFRAYVLGTVTASSTTVTVPSTSGLVVGQQVTSEFGDVPAGTVITAIVDGTTVTISQPAISSMSFDRLTFGDELLSFGSLTVAGLANGGAPSAIGMSGNAPANLVLDNGTLQYTGSGASTDRNFTLTNNGGALDASGAGAVAFTNTGAIATSGSGARTLTLTGTSTALNALSMSLADGAGGATSLVKNGAGTWVLSNGASTYTGGTTINSGTLLVTNSTGSATGSGNVEMNGGILGGSGIIAGTIQGGSGAHTIAPSVTLSPTSATTLSAGGLSTNANTTISLNLVTPGTAHTGAGSVNDAINITGNNGLNLSGGKLVIANTSTGAASLGYYRIIQYSGAIQGTGISSLTLPAVANRVAYTLSTTRDPGYVDIHRGLLGDANDDGLVNFADFVVLSNNFGLSNKGWSGGDFNGDGITNFADFVILSNNFGATIGSNEVASAGTIGVSDVPEPASLVLLGAGLLGVIGAHRRTRAR